MDMYDEILGNVLKVLKSVLNNKEIVIDSESSMYEIGMGSLNFMNMVVKLEDLYDIEFEDEYLIETSFSKVDDIVTYLIKMIGKRNEK